MVRLQGAHCRFRIELNDVIEHVFADIHRTCSQRFDQALRRGRGLLPLSREIHLDPLAGAIGGQQSAARMKARLLVRRESPFLPKRVRAGERCVAAQIHFDRRSEPAQIEAVPLRD